MQRFFCKSDVLKENNQTALKKITLFFYRTACHTLMSFVCHSYVLVCHPCVTRVYSYFIRISPVYHLYVTRMSSVYHSYVLVCHSYVARMYSYVIRMSLVCTLMSFVCHSCVVVCHSYVTRMWFYHEPLDRALI